MNMQNTQKKWFQSTGGAIFLGFIIILLVGGLIFMGLISYFLFNMKYGNSSSLFKKYNTKNKTEQTVNIDTNILIREHNPIYGSLDASVTIIAFEDFECPFCRKSFPIMKKIKEKYGSAIKIVFKNTPIVNIHTEALLAHNAAACAHDQDKFWDYYDLLYTTQKLDKDSLLSYAELLSINNSKFQQCLNSSIHLNHIETDLKDAAKIDFQGTPTYIVNGVKYEGVLSEEEWSNLILQNLKQN